MSFCTKDLKWQWFLLYHIVFFCFFWWFMCIEHVNAFHLYVNNRHYMSRHILKMFAYFFSLLKILMSIYIYIVEMCHFVCVFTYFFFCHIALNNTYSLKNSEHLLRPVCWWFIHVELQPGTWKTTTTKDSCSHVLLLSSSP